MEDKVFFFLLCSGYGKPSKMQMRLVLYTTDRKTEISTGKLPLAFWNYDFFFPHNSQTKSFFKRKDFFFILPFFLFFWKTLCCNIFTFGITIIMQRWRGSWLKDMSLFSKTSKNTSDRDTREKRMSDWRFRYTSPGEWYVLCLSVLQTIRLLSA